MVLTNFGSRPKSFRARRRKVDFVSVKQQDKGSWSDQEFSGSGSQGRGEGQPHSVGSPSDMDVSRPKFSGKKKKRSQPAASLTADESPRKGSKGQWKKK